MSGPVDMSQLGPVNPECIRLGQDLRRMTQKALADASGVPARKISRYARGLEEVPRDDMVKMAEALDFPLSFFYQTDFQRHSSYM